MQIDRAPYGFTSGGRQIHRYTLSNASGLQAQIINYGGILTSVTVPDRAGNLADVVLGLSSLHQYETRNAPYFGALVGRYANRIDRGAFTLDGVTYRLDTSHDPNALHGGSRNFARQVWDAEPLAGRDGEVSVRLIYMSPDGECGYPGALTAIATYTVTRANEIRIDFEATADRPTPVNLTNHSYWNLAGEGAGSIDDHLLYLNAGHYTPTTPALIPTGEIAAVDGTPFDFRTPSLLGPAMRSSHPHIVIGRGLDHNFVIDRPSSANTSLLLAARLADSSSGRALEVWTTQPGIQVYTGNFLDGVLYGPSRRAYRQGDGIALETQHFPDSPNQPHFPSTILRPGEIYRETTVFRFT